MHLKLFKLGSNKTQMNSQSPSDYITTIAPAPPRDMSSTEKAVDGSVTVDANLTVIELFQSQGCSSCPPSNSNVIAVSEDPNSLILTYEVTYWDYLGWEDTFGNSEFDRRQWDYARAFGSTRVYTPQVIINGRSEGVGNRNRDLDNLIERGKRSPANHNNIKITTNSQSNTLTVSGSGDLADVMLIRYDPRTISVKIACGENGGRTLPHKNIVREITRLGKWGGGEETFALPAKSGDALESAILLQAGSGGAVVGAARI